MGCKRRHVGEYCTFLRLEKIRVDICFSGVSLRAGLPPVSALGGGQGLQETKRSFSSRSLRPAAPSRRRERDAGVQPHAEHDPLFDQISREKPAFAVWFR